MNNDSNAKHFYDAVEQSYKYNLGTSKFCFNVHSASHSLIKL